MVYVHPLGVIFEHNLTQAVISYHSTQCQAAVLICEVTVVETIAGSTSQTTGTQPKLLHVFLFKKLACKKSFLKDAEFQQ